MTERFEAYVDAFPRRTSPLLMTGIVAGDPHLGATRAFMTALVDGGADVLELVLPFSDPTFHGAVMRRACQRALNEHVRWEGVAEVVSDFRKTEEEVPVVVTSYLNRVLHLGLERCAELLSSAGADGLMVMDLPASEAQEIKDVLEAQGLALIQSVGPSTTVERFQEIAGHARGLLVWTGHCGAEAEDAAEHGDRLKVLRKHTRIPLVASMGVESGEDAAEVAQKANGVLVGSSLAWLIEGGADVEDRLRGFVAELRLHLDRLGD